MRNIILCFLIVLSSSITFANYDINKARKTIAGVKSNYIEFHIYKNHYYSLIQNHKKALIVSTGVAEPAIKYWEFVDQFKETHDIYLWDHINQGKSPDLILAMDFRKVYIDDFKNYQTTFNNFLSSIKKNYEEIHVVSHSMGSHVMIRQLIKEPSSINKLVLVTPMLDVQRFLIPSSIVKFILKTFYELTDWAPLQSGKNPESKYLTGSKENFENYMELINSDFPKQLSTGVTAGWFIAALRSVKYVFNSNYQSLKTPMLMFTAGNDVVVQSKAAKKFCSKIKSCEQKHYERGQHQLLMETDDIRLDIFKKIKKFLYEDSLK